MTSFTQHLNAMIIDNLYPPRLTAREENMLLGYYWGHIDKFKQVSSHLQLSLIFIKVPL
jgi:hypothetical protein